MGWLIPKHSCGHEGERYQAYGKMDDRYRRLAQIEKLPCPDCLKEAAEDADMAANLPPMTGTDKQIAWASDIRRRIMVGYDSLMAQTQTAPRGNEVKVCLQAIREIKDSRWWIDNKNSDLQTLLQIEMRRRYPVLQVA